MMTRLIHWHIGVWCMVLMLVAATGWVAEADSSRRPNVILVFIDDMGWGDLSCFGNTDASTPHADRLAAEGLAFEQFYVNSPICSPSRVAISTGQYPQRWDITSYLARRELNERRGMAQWLDPRAPMLARQLQKAGYATGHFGKWHMGGQRDVDDAPPIAAYGFDESLTNFEGMGAKLLPLTMKPGWTEPGRIWEDAVRLGGPVTWRQRSTITEGFVEAALRFIRAAQERNQPFYVNVWPDDVHSPFFPPVARWGDTKRELYLAVLETMDEQLGRLFDHVRNEEGLRKNTLILLCSDNGPEPGAGQAGDFRGSKATLYEGGIRSPLIVWGAGFLAETMAGKRNSTSVFSAMDLAPSLLKFCGVEEEAMAKDLDGENVLDTLLGKSKASRQAPLFFSRPPDRKDYQPYRGLPDLAMRNGSWKLLCDEDGSRAELYHLGNDPGESENLSEVRAGRTASMKRALLGWAEEVLGAD